MADNITLNPGSGGEEIASDDIGGVQYPIEKIAYGDLGETNLVDRHQGFPVQAAEGQKDAFHRFRVSSPHTLFDSKFLHDKAPLEWDEQIVNTSGNATSTHVAVDALVETHVETNDAVVRQTFKSFNYSPGKSQLIVLTALFDSGTGVTTKYGVWDGSDGLYFQQDDTTLSVAYMKNGSATTIASGSWNIDSLDGSGPSGKIIDVTKGQIFVIDFEWLSLGRVRFGCIIDEQLIYVHEVLNANVVTSAYMSTPNLPLRFTCNSTSASATSKHICSAIMSEGGVSSYGRSFYVSNGDTNLDADVAGTLYAGVGYRLQSTALDKIASVASLSMIVTTTDPVEWVLMLNPTVAGTFTFADLTGSHIQTAFGATANVITGGTALDGGFIETSGQIHIDPAQLVWPGSSLASVPDEIVLCCRPLGALANVYSSITVLEAS